MLLECIGPVRCTLIMTAWLGKGRRGHAYRGCMGGDYSPAPCAGCTALARPGVDIGNQRAPLTNPAIDALNALRADLNLGPIEAAGVFGVWCNSTRGGRR